MAVSARRLTLRPRSNPFPRQVAATRKGPGQCSLFTAWRGFQTMNTKPLTAEELSAIPCACVHSHAETCARWRDGAYLDDLEYIRRECECSCHQLDLDDGGSDGEW